ncbi:MAG: SemiSWEET transporter [Methanoregula sp.]|nr:SemiSWEET transporter [Methanoregula sp.]
MEIITYIGYIAGALSSLAFFPQVIKSWKEKKTEDISIVMVLLSVTGVSLWIIYGLAINAIPLVAANALTFILMFSLLLLKLQYH